MKANGIYWILLSFLERIGYDKNNFKKKRLELEINRQLPGFNTIMYNRKEWSEYNWETSGEEWNDSKEWKESLIKDVLLKYIEPKKVVLEIGPGGGRWSEPLAMHSEKLILVDITQESINTCSKKLSGFNNCEFYVNNGTDLSFLLDDSIDYLWSFDVFVHISPDDTAAYLEGLSVKMKKGAIGIIHHPAEGGIKGGFRSSTTNEVFCQFLRELNFNVLHQFNSWGVENSFNVNEYDDLITVFKKE